VCPIPGSRAIEQEIVAAAIRWSYGTRAKSSYHLEPAGHIATLQREPETAAGCLRDSNPKRCGDRTATVDLAKIGQLVDLVSRSRIAELDLTQDGTRIRILKSPVPGALRAARKIHKLSG
jgi:hypothetical protein